MECGWKDSLATQTAQCRAVLLLLEGHPTVLPARRVSPLDYDSRHPRFVHPTNPSCASLNIIFPVLDQGVMLHLRTDWVVAAPYTGYVTLLAPVAGREAHTSCLADTTGFACKTDTCGRKCCALLADGLLGGSGITLGKTVLGLVLFLPLAWSSFSHHKLSLASGVLTACPDGEMRPETGLLRARSAHCVLSKYGKGWKKASGVSPDDMLSQLRF